MAILYFTGFEDGQFKQDSGDYPTGGATAGATQSIVTSPTQGGTYSLKLDCPTSERAWMNIPIILSDGRLDSSNTISIPTIYTQFDFQYTTKPASGSEEIFSARDNGDTPKLTIKLDSNGKLNIYDASNTQIGSAGSTTLNSGTWYSIRVKVGTSATVGSYEVQINGSSEFSGTGNLGANNNGIINLGKRRDTSSQSIVIYYDNVILADNAFPTAGAIVKAIVPTANGSTMNWANGTGASDYTQVDEIPYDTSDYILTTTGAGTPIIALFAMQDCSTVNITGSILAVKNVIITRENASNSSAHFPRIKSSSTTLDTSTFNGSTVHQGQTILALTDPNTGSAWTTSGLDAVEMGVVENNNVSVRCISVIGYVLFVPSTSVDYPMTASQGSFTLTGQTTLLKFGRKMLATYASFVLTGQSALLKIGKKIIASFGSFTLTGQSATFRKALRMLASQASFTLTGFATSLRLGKGMLATMGNFNTTFQDFLIHRGIKIPITYGAFVLTGQDALLKIGRTMSAIYAQFNLTGQSVLLKLGLKMSAVYGQFTLTGQDIIFRLGKELVAVYGSFTLTGQDVVFRVSRIMQAVYGSFTLTGQAVRFARNGIYTVWKNVAKASTSWGSKVKNVASWINKNKNL